MGYRSRAKGHIVVTPAIPYVEAVDTDFAVQGYRGNSILEFKFSEESTSIFPRWTDEFKAYLIEDELQTIINIWGKDRQFSGYITIHGEGDGVGDLDLWRLSVKDNKPYAVIAKVAWPED